MGGAGRSLNGRTRSPDRGTTPDVRRLQVQPDASGRSATPGGAPAAQAEGTAVIGRPYSDFAVPPFPVGPKLVLCARQKLGWSQRPGRAPCPRCARLGPLGRPQGSRSTRSRRAALGIALRPELFRDPESEFARSVTFPLRPHFSPTAFLLGRLSRPRAVRPGSLAPSFARCFACSLAPSLPPSLADPRPQRRPRGVSGEPLRAVFMTTVKR